MTSANKANAFATLDAFADSRVALIQGMKDAGYKTVEDCKPVVIEWACGKCKAAFNVSKSGKVMLDSGHKNYEKAKYTVRDVMLMIQGTTRHKASAKKESAPKVVIMGCETIEEAMEAFKVALAAKFK